MAASTSTRAELAASLREENGAAGEILERLEARTNEAVMPLGVILRQRGKLTMAQLIELSHMQSNNPRLRLGELAVKQGWCTLMDVEEALALQRREHLLDLVTGAEACTSARSACSARVTLRRPRSASLSSRAAAAPRACRRRSSVGAGCARQALPASRPARESRSAKDSARRIVR